MSDLGVSGQRWDEGVGGADEDRCRGDCGTEGGRYRGGCGSSCWSRCCGESGLSGRGGRMAGQAAEPQTEMMPIDVAGLGVTAGMLHVLGLRPVAGVSPGACPTLPAM